MNNKIFKMLTILITFMLILSIGCSIVSASSATNIIEGMKNSSSNVNSNEITTVGGKLLGIAQTVGIVIAVLILTVLGIKYMMGSAEEKAEYKKTMIPYIVGAILIFAAPALANMIYNLISNMG